METTKIEANDKDIHIDCPCCDMWEQLGIDDPRHMLNVLPIIEWKEDEEKELSVHKCTQCSNEFQVEWDYNNPMA